jgi:hypothetical protein
MTYGPFSSNKIQIGRETVAAGTPAAADCCLAWASSRH